MRRSSNVEVPLTCIVVQPATFMKVTGTSAAKLTVFVSVEPVLVTMLLTDRFW